ncbi:O-acetyl-ADP-ribose deacetylase [candidate division Kazan bacterium RIFCSPHIGHO2_01_FULL_44_14]|uniref:O-acetyl-ADP-ribose deacetylase n=1 Tax=candidate division Kazan bacterium RIFCSPLOWO2_01_FULL_45_19 TaxID=1798538 RepID=A0A1F4NPF9_UNCK3|nr:MAG: O-acetyl-ADP-ribose deacetylase [candidate division Kazan bacterium RIFCSPLOWO2_01_FULL_45_19]OGB77586.1 MAG: O-acetyl-ADP-ribose deacetylase [candidate division Kazan bacterium RIFCSPHIGHO2_01_FULL_44_14]
MKYKPVLIKGDITAQDADVIVNSANNRLTAGGGVSGAIHRVAGLGLTQECRKLGYCPTGEARITAGHNLLAKYVIHTVGPVFGQERGGEAEILKNCYVSSLRLAAEYGAKSIAFPCISTGIFGYPKDEAAKIAIWVVKSLDLPIEVRFVVSDDENYLLYSNLLASGNQQLRVG